jgi:hypothetical protein
MEGSGRRQLLVSTGWVQAFCSPCSLGSSSSASWPTGRTRPSRRRPNGSSIPEARCATPPRTSGRASRSSSTTGSWSTARCSATGAYLGQDYTADYLRRSSDFVRRSYGGVGSDRAAQRTIEDFRTNRYDERTRTATLTVPQAEAHRRLVGHYSRFFSEPTTKHGLRLEAITDREQLQTIMFAVGLLAHRDPFRRVRPLALPRLARPRTGDAVVQIAGGRCPYPRPAGVRVVLLRHGCAVLDPDVRRCGQPALRSQVGRRNLGGTIEAAPSCRAPLLVPDLARPPG